jgi:hypothetical protein
LKNKEHGKQSSMKYLSMLYAWNTNLWKYGFFLTVFSNKPINQSKPTSLVWFLFWKIVKTKPNQTKPMKISLVQTFFWPKIDPNQTVTPLLDVFANTYRYVHWGYKRTLTTWTNTSSVNIKKNKVSPLVGLGVETFTAW